MSGTAQGRALREVENWSADNGMEFTWACKCVPGKFSVVVCTFNNAEEGTSQEELKVHNGRSSCQSKYCAGRSHLGKSDGQLLIKDHGEFLSLLSNPFQGFFR